MGRTLGIALGHSLSLLERKETQGENTYGLIGSAEKPGQLAKDMDGKRLEGIRRVGFSHMQWA